MAAVPGEKPQVAEAPPNTRIFRFGLFELNTSDLLLRKDGRIQPRLREQSLQLLLVLLDRPGEVVSREQLHKEPWTQYRNQPASKRAGRFRNQSAIHRDAATARLPLYRARWSPRREHRENIRRSSWRRITCRKFA